MAFPAFDPSSITGKILLSATLKAPELLERLPSWWAHIYAAHLYEYQEQLVELLGRGPVITTNYILSFKYWCAALGAHGISHNVKGYFPDAIQPKAGYLILGETWKAPGNVPLKMSFEFENRFRLTLYKVLDSKIHRVRPTFETAHKAEYANNIARTICKDAAKRFKLVDNPLYVYPKELFDVV